MHFDFRQSQSSGIVQFATLGVCALSLITLQAKGVEQIVQATTAVACIAILLAARRDLWSYITTATTRRLLAALGMYTLLAGTVALLTSGPAWNHELSLGTEILKQAFFLLILVALVAGFRTILRRSEIERLMSALLGILSAGCVLVLLTPFGDRLGIVSFGPSSVRSGGTFRDPNDAGLLAVLTILLALTLHDRLKHRRLVGFCYLVAVIALLLSLSNTAAVAWIAVICTFACLQPLRSLKRSSLLIMGASVLIAGLYLTWSLSSVDLARLNPLDLFEGDPPYSHQISCDTHAGTVEVYVFDSSSDSPLPDYDLESPTASASALRGTRTSSSESATGQVELPLPDYDLESPTASASALRGTRTSSSESATGRVELWRSSIEMLAEDPLFGLGLRALDRFPSRLKNPASDLAGPGSHNVYILLVGEAGPLPLLFYLAFLALVASRVLTAKPGIVRSVVGGSLVVIVLYGLVYHHLIYSSLFMLIFALMTALADDEPTDAGLGPSTATAQSDSAVGSGI